jgi:tetratricopeptide (TPR) repeat protein
MHAENPRIEVILKKANDREEKFQWLEAAHLYEKALHTKGQPTSLTTEIMEKIGFSYVRASTQADDLKTFKKLRELAIKTYRNAAELLEREKNVENEGRSYQLKAIAECANSWLADDPSQKMRMLKICDSYCEKALNIYEKGANKSQFVRVYNILSMSALEQVFLASNIEEKQTLVQERIKSSDEITTALSGITREHGKKDILLAYSLASLQYWYAANISDKEDERKKLAKRSLTTSEKALKISEKVQDPYYVAMSRWAATISTLFFAEKSESSLKYANEMLQQGTTQKDHYIKGIAYYLLAFVTDLMRWKVVDPEKGKKTHKNAINYAEEAIYNLQLTAQDYYIAETYRLYIENQSNLANDEIDIDTKRTLLDKAINNGQKGLEHATRSGSPEARGSILHALSKTMHTNSIFESEKDNKRRSLENALLHRKNYIRLAEKAFTSNKWILGVGKYYAGLIESELSQLETNQTSKITLFSEAVGDMADGVSHCQNWVLSRPNQSYIAFTAEFEDTFGRILYESYILTGEKVNLTKAIEVYSEAIKKFKIIDRPSRVAESFWKIARDKDLLGQYQDASESFEEAYKQYMVAAQKIHQFADFYQDYASYMKAWSEIERARDFHAKKRYEQAKEKYEKAASINESIERWNHLSLNYFALAKLEEAESLSRDEQADKARELFQQTIELFDGAKESITANVKKIQDANQEKITIELDGTINSRKEYCFGRIALEDAKILDRQGDHLSSAKKFGEAVKIFGEMSEKSSKGEYRELQSIIFLCRAWERMMLGEAKVYTRSANEFIGFSK